MQLPLLPQPQRQQILAQLGKISISWRWLMLSSSDYPHFNSTTSTITPREKHSPNLRIFEMTWKKVIFHAHQFPCSSSCANVNIVRFEGLYPFRLDQSLFITNGGICVFYFGNPRCTQTPTAAVIFMFNQPSTDPHQRSRPRTSSSLAHWKSSRRFPWKAQLATGELTPQLIYMTHDISRLSRFPPNKLSKRYI